MVRFDFIALEVSTDPVILTFPTVPTARNERTILLPWLMLERSPLPRMTFMFSKIISGFAASISCMELFSWRKMASANMLCSVISNWDVISVGWSYIDRELVFYKDGFYGMI